MPSGITTAATWSVAHHGEPEFAPGTAHGKQRGGRCRRRLRHHLAKSVEWRAQYAQIFGERHAALAQRSRSARHSKHPRPSRWKEMVTCAGWKPKWPALTGAMPDIRVRLDANGVPRKRYRREHDNDRQSGCALGRRRWHWRLHRVWNNPVLQRNGSNPEMRSICDVYGQRYVIPPAPLMAARPGLSTSGRRHADRKPNPCWPRRYGGGRSPARTPRAARRRSAHRRLPGNTLGQAQGTITLDANAAGWGWFVDLTPRGDSEFIRRGDQGERTTWTASP